MVEGGQCSFLLLQHTTVGRLQDALLELPVEMHRNIKFPYRKYKLNLQVSIQIKSVKC